MEGLIWAAVSLILLVPVLFILPLGLKVKGKFMLLATSFLIAIVGIIAQTTFLLWQSVLIVVVLAFLTAYLLDQRVGKTFFVSASNKNEVAVSKVDTIINSNGNVKEVEQVEYFPAQAVVEPIEELTMEPNLTVEEALFEKENLPSKEKNDESLLIEEDITFLLNRDKLPVADFEKNTDESSIPSQEMSYMKEIEEILAADKDIDAWMESKNIQQQEIAVTLEDESSTLHEDEAELVELPISEPSIKAVTSSNKGIITTWEEDEIQPLHFENQPQSLRKLGVKKIKEEVKDDY